MEIEWTPMSIALKTDKADTGVALFWIKVHFPWATGTTAGVLIGKHSAYTFFLVYLHVRGTS